MDLQGTQLTNFKILGDDILSSHIVLVKYMVTIIT